MMPDEPRSPDPTGDGGTPFPWFAVPGSPDTAGCTCPTVANIGYRTGLDLQPLLDPECPVHPPEQPPDDGAEAGVDDRSAGIRAP